MSDRSVSEPTKPQFTALLLGAGDSQRMGQPKATLTIEGGPAWLRLARISIGAGASKVLILVSADVLGLVVAQLPPDRDEARRLQPLAVPEELRSRGPAGSILHGLRTAPGAAGWLLWPIDHPFVAASSIERLAGEGLVGDRHLSDRPLSDRPAGAPPAGVGCTIRIPCFEGRRGHPIYVHGDCGQELHDTLVRGGTLREFWRNQPQHVVQVAVADPAIHWNCDSPAAFRDYLTKLEQRRG